MEQHRVPQNIATYQFRLVGDMTLKQFAELATGAILAFLFYSLPLPLFFKWPAVFLFSLLGIALAFLPIEERPLDRWLLSFIRSIYSPTQYFWHKEPIVPIFLQKRVVTTTEEMATAVTGDEKKLKEYLTTLPVKPTDGADQKEAVAVSKINQLLQKEGLKLVTTTPMKTVTPTFRVAPGIRVRKLGETMDSGIIFKKPITEMANLPPPQMISAEQKKRETGPTVIFKPLITPGLSNWQKVTEEKPPVQATARAAQPSTIGGLPKTDSPNVLSGVVLTSDGKFLEGAIVALMDANDLPVRALKTNALGQFFSATPLKDGQYRIETEKEGYTFDIISLEAKGKILLPIEIRAKETKQTDNLVKILEY